MNPQLKGHPFVTFIIITVIKVLFGLDPCFFFFADLVWLLKSNSWTKGVIESLLDFWSSTAKNSVVIGIAWAGWWFAVPVKVIVCLWVSASSTRKMATIHSGHPKGTSCPTRESEPVPGAQVASSSSWASVPILPNVFQSNNVQHCNLYPGKDPASATLSILPLSERRLQP